MNSLRSSSRSLLPICRNLQLPVLLIDLHSLFIPKSRKSSDRRLKKCTYYPVSDLDRVMELQKKTSLILRLKDIILRQKDQGILLRDLKKEVGVVQKWNLMSIIERYPSVFRVTGGIHRPHLLQLTEKAMSIAEQEADYVGMMEPIAVNNVRRLLMMSADCRIPVQKIEMIRSELGLSLNFKTHVIPKYQEFFKLQAVNGREFLQMENWDFSLAVTARELNRPVYTDEKERRELKKCGNFDGEYAFRIEFPRGFRANVKYVEGFIKWQKLAFPSPYLNARQFNPATPPARKRAIAVLHELLSLTLEKRLTSAQLDLFHAEYRLPCRLLPCLVKNHGIFYLTNKGVRSTVFLKEGYVGSCLVEKSPITRFNDKFLGLIGRSDGEVEGSVPLRLGHVSV